MIKQIAHACIVTNNLKNTINFYKRVLQLKVHFKFIKDKKIIGYYLKCGNNTFIEIFENKNMKETSSESSLKHICFEVVSIKKIASHLKKMKINYSEPRIGSDNSWQLWIEDPNGVKIEFHQYTKNSTQITKKDCKIM